MAILFRILLSARKISLLDVSMANAFLALVVWPTCTRVINFYYIDVIMGAITSQITSLTIVFSTVYSDADQRKHQSSASLAFERGIHWGPVNSPHKWPVTRKMFPFYDVIMNVLGSIFSVYIWWSTHQSIHGDSTNGARLSADPLMTMNIARIFPSHIGNWW